MPPARACAWTPTASPRAVGAAVLRLACWRKLCVWAGGPAARGGAACAARWREARRDRHPDHARRCSADIAEDAPFVEGRYTTAYLAERGAYLPALRPARAA